MRRGFLKLYTGFVLLGEIEFPDDQCKRCIVLTEHIILAFIQLHVAMKETLIKGSQSSQRAKKIIIMKKSSACRENHHITSYNHLSLKEINRTVKIKKKKFIEFTYKSELIKKLAKKYKLILEGFTWQLQYFFILIYSWKTLYVQIADSSNKSTFAKLVSRLVIYRTNDFIFKFFRVFF